MMDVERWKNCGFVSCPNAGSYFCQTSCQSNGFSSPTAFVAVTQSGLCGKGIALETSGGAGFTSTTIQDCGPGGIEAQRRGVSQGALFAKTAGASVWLHLLPDCWKTLLHVIPRRRGISRCHYFQCGIPCRVYPEPQSGIPLPLRGIGMTKRGARNDIHGKHFSATRYRAVRSINQTASVNCSQFLTSASNCFRPLPVSA